ncbi:hypothetical protein SpCBS45565_g06691 [Spizellomyces sp. 'palustris']|nr:hypothetical protein SpCBS45565_g06691 [Spizellomyces sp. 'palustris']
MASQEALIVVPASAPIMAIGILLLSIFAWKLLFSYRSTIPNPEGSLPIIGSTLLIRPYLDGKRFFKFIVDQQKQLGPIFNLNMLGAFTPVVCDIKEARKILTDSQLAYRDNTFQKAAIGIAEHALFMLPSGSQWKYHRKLVAPAFSPFHLRKIFAESVQHTDGLIKAWRSLMSSSPSSPPVVNLHHHMQCLTLDIVGAVALGGYSFNSLAMLGTPETTNYKTEQVTAFEYLVQAAGDRWGLPQWIWPMLGVGKEEVKRPSKVTRQVAMEIMEKRREELKTIGDTLDKKEMDVLDRLLTQGSDGDAEPLTTEELLDEIIGFILASHETSSNAATATLFHLIQKAASLQRLLNEIDQVVGKDGILTWENVHALKYLELVVKETLRVSGPVAMIGRNMTKDAVILGHHVPKNSPVILNVKGMQTDPRYWGPDAEEFRPERWEEARDETSDAAYIPFGTGPMMCVGWKMAVLEVKIILIRILQEFSMTLLPDQDFSWTVDGITCGYKKGVLIHIKDRETS